jgi:RNA polymerase I-specific transcription initiation factor RRN6
MVKSTDQLIEIVANVMTEFSLILHSRLNGLAQFYVFDDHRSTTTLSTFDPTLLRLAGEELLDTIQIHMEPMPIGESSQEAYHFGPGRSYMARGIKFYRIFVLQSDLSVHEFVVHSHKSVVMESDNDVPTVEDFKRSLVRHPRRDASRREVIEEEDSNPFIPDGLQVMDGPMCKIASQLPTTLRTHHRASVNSARDYTLLYSALDQDGKCFERPTKTTDIATLMTKIQQMLITELDPQSPLDTL